MASRSAPSSRRSTSLRNASTSVSAKASGNSGMPPPATIQNVYSLLCRSYEEGLAEACSPRHHNVGLLPWSVLCSPEPETLDPKP